MVPKGWVKGKGLGPDRWNSGHSEQWTGRTLVACCRSGSYAHAWRGQSVSAVLADAVQGCEWRGCPRHVPRPHDPAHQAHSQHRDHDVDVRGGRLPVSTPRILSQYWQCPVVCSKLVASICVRGPSTNLWWFASGRQRGWSCHHEW